jgi:hypothetical protein
MRLIQCLVSENSFKLVLEPTYLLTILSIIIQSGISFYFGLINDNCLFI